MIKQQSYKERYLYFLMKSELIEIGLEEREADIYLELLKKSQQNANSLSKETKINRSVVYSIIDKLIEKGLVSNKIINGVKYFSASDPRSLTDLLDQKKRILSKLIPNLKSIKMKEKEEVSMELFQGLNGGITVMKDIINEGENYLSFGNGEGFSGLGTIAEQYIRKINEKKIKEKLLLKKTKEPLLKGKYSEVRFLPDNFDLPVITTIYGNKVAIAILEEPQYTILIKSKSLATTYRNLFEGLWRISRKK